MPSATESTSPTSNGGRKCSSTQARSSSGACRHRARRRSRGQHAVSQPLAAGVDAADQRQVLASRAATLARRRRPITSPIQCACCVGSPTDSSTGQPAAPGVRATSSHRTFDVDARAGRALSRQPKGRAHRSPGRALQVGVAADDGGVLAAHSTMQGRGWRPCTDSAAPT